MLVVGMRRSGVAAARALLARGVAVVGVDSGDAEPLDGAEVVARCSGVELLDRVAWVCKSPGVPPRAEVVAAAHARGLPVLGELEVAWRLVPHEVVAVSGTNGKTTVTEWIGHVHRVAGRPVAVVGNVGTAYATLALAPPPAPTTVVAECSSYQLHDAVAFAPEVAVLLNVASDHLDWHGSVEAYRAAKEKLFARQTRPPDVAIRPDDPLPDVGEITLPGAHNRVNARFVAAACRARGIGEEAIAEGLRTFTGVAHRLQEVATVDGVRYINDSKATNVASTLVALEAFAAPLRLILGGDDAKQEDFAPLREPVLAKAASVHLIGAAAPRLREALGVGQVDADLPSAVASARAAARPGDVVLLSPACASFGEFRDFEHRGEVFAALVSP